MEKIISLFGGWHLLFEYLAFFVAYRYYIVQRKSKPDTISSKNRLSIILGAAIGALIGSRLFGYLENPFSISSYENIILLTNTKTIMGGLFGGLLGVELTKKRIGEQQSSGDLFTLPIILGIFIGRIGCFLAGTNEFVYGKPTTLFIGMDLGDDIRRHPIVLYELLFLLILFFLLNKKIKNHKSKEGTIFKLFMIAYFSFRFFIEFLKPNTFFTFGLSSIQFLCLLCILYYYKFIFQRITYAYKKIYLL